MNFIPSGPGYYGKFPILGDFVSRWMPGEFIRIWDDWLQECLVKSREHLGSDWLDVYLTSPIWRFVLTSGTCGATAWAGILMPSVDKVGRYFPLTLAAAIDNNLALPDLFSSSASWFDKLEQLALTSLDHDFDLNFFDQSLQKEALQVVPSPARKQYTAVGKKNNGKTSFHVEMEDLAEIDDAVIHLTSFLMAELVSAYSFWSTHGSERVKPSLLVYEGLPPASAYAEFLSGKWRLTPRTIPIANLSSKDEPNFFEKTPITPEANNDVLRWRSCAKSITGKRKINEDAFLELPDLGLWAVADGMGGHSAGEVASKAVVDTLHAVAATADIEIFTTRVVDCLQKVNAELITMARQNGQDTTIGSTVVVMLARENRCVVLWAGDSRLYRLQDGVLTQLTEDHSLVAEISRQGVFADPEAADTLSSNIITRALGATPELAVDKIAYEAKSGDVYLLCSDGLVRELSPDEIKNILGQGGCAASSEALINLASARGARDNVTVVVVQAISEVSSQKSEVRSQKSEP